MVVLHIGIEDATSIYGIHLACVPSE